MSALASPFRDDDAEPATTMCAGSCRRFIRVTLPARTGRYESRKPVAYSEDRDVYGRTRYYCRRCTEAIPARLG